MLCKGPCYFVRHMQLRLRGGFLLAETLVQNASGGATLIKTRKSSGTACVLPAPADGMAQAGAHAASQRQPHADVYTRRQDQVRPALPCPTMLPCLALPPVGRGDLNPLQCRVIELPRFPLSIYHNRSI